MKDMCLYSTRLESNCLFTLNEDISSTSISNNIFNILTECTTLSTTQPLAYRAVQWQWKVVLLMKLTVTLTTHLHTHFLCSTEMYLMKHREAAPDVLPLHQVVTNCTWRLRSSSGSTQVLLSILRFFLCVFIWRRAHRSQPCCCPQLEVSGTTQTTVHQNQPGWTVNPSSAAQIKNLWGWKMEVNLTLETTCF